MTELVAAVPVPSFKLRRLGANDLDVYRDIRLESLKRHPEAFASSWEHEADKPASWWAERLETSIVLGGWVNTSPLAGVAGLCVEDIAKLRHKGVLWGMYVRPEAPGTGLAAALVQAVLAHGLTRVERVCLSVVMSNVAARRLYGAAGFEEYGLERRALKIVDAYYDEVLMAVQLHAPSEQAHV